MKHNFNLPDVEQRSLTVDDLEVRAVDDRDAPIEFRGTAIHFDRKTDVMGLFREQFRAGAFTKTIVESNIVMLQQHDPTKVLARNRASTMQLTETPTGLRVEAQWARTSYAEDLATNIRARNISEMSIGFRPIREEWDESTRPLPTRSITEAALNDISVVIFPVHSGTTAAVRSAAQLPALYDLLGITDLDEETRSKMLLQVALGDVDAQFAPILKAAQEHLATFTERAGLVPPVPAPDGDAGDNPPRLLSSEDDLEMRRLRMAHRARRPF